MLGRLTDAAFSEVIFILVDEISIMSQLTQIESLVDRVGTASDNQVKRYYEATDRCEWIEYHEHLMGVLNFMSLKNSIVAGKHWW